jgi:hypothetical protein
MELGPVHRHPALARADHGEAPESGSEEIIYKSGPKKIIGLSCGRKNGNSETLLKEAAMGAEEFGIETEIIRAAELNIKPCRGCDGCLVALSHGHIASCSVRDDDVEWDSAKNGRGGLRPDRQLPGLLFPA